MCSREVTRVFDVNITENILRTVRKVGKIRGQKKQAKKPSNELLENFIRLKKPREGEHNFKSIYLS